MTFMDVTQNPFKSAVREVIEFFVVFGLLFVWSSCHIIDRETEQREGTNIYRLLLWFYFE